MTRTIILTTVAAAACGEPTPAPDGRDLLAAALGTVPSRLEYRATGTRYEPLEGSRPDVPIQPSAFSLTVAIDLVEDRARLGWQREFTSETVAPAQLAYAEIVTSEHGYVDADDAVFGAGSPRALQPARIAAVRRQQRLLLPSLYLADLLRAPRAVVDLGVEDALRIVEADDEPRPVRFAFDVAGDTPVLVRATTREHDLLLGDVAIEVEYAAWETTLGTAIPAEVTLRWEGQELHREQRTAIAIDPTLDDATFTLPATVPFDAAAAAHGAASEQWYHRGLALPFGGGFVDASLGGPIQVLSLSDSIAVIAGISHNTLAVDVGTSIVVIDPAIADARSQQVLAAIAGRWPGKPVSHIVVTHHHYDHVGGVRAYVASGATVVAPAGDRGFFEDVLARPRTIRPDALVGGGARAVLVVDDAPLDLGGVVLHRHASSHADEMLTVCIPSAGLAFSADLWNSGFAMPGQQLPEPQRTFARELRDVLATRCPETQAVLGVHGSPIPDPIAILVETTTRP